MAKAADRSGVAAFARAVEAGLRDNARPDAYWWTHNVNHRIASGVVLALRDRVAITPNVLTLSALVVYGATAVYIGFSGAPTSAAQAVLIAVALQVAYTLDCADGQLARARRAASAFGQWLDRLCDVTSHVFLLTALGVVAATSVRLGPLEAALVGGGVVGASCVQLFATFYRNEVLGAQPRAGRSSWARRLVMRLLPITDHGVFLVAASIGLLWPVATVAVLLAYGMAWTAMAVGQVLLNWPHVVLSVVPPESA